MIDGAGRDRLEEVSPLGNVLTLPEVMSRLASRAPDGRIAINVVRKVGLGFGVESYFGGDVFLVKLGVRKGVKFVEGALLPLAMKHRKMTDLREIGEMELALLGTRGRFFDLLVEGELVKEGSPYPEREDPKIIADMNRRGPQSGEHFFYKGRVLTIDRAEGGRVFFEGNPEPCLRAIIHPGSRVFCLTGECSGQTVREYGWFCDL